MNEAHLHLLVNHIPVIGAVVSLIALTVAIFWKSQDFRKSALIMALVFGLSAIPAYFSGEAAEEIVEEAGSSHELIEHHEEAAKLATITAIVSGLAAGGALLLKNGRTVGTYAATVLFLITVVLMTRAANSGGQIMHPEIRGDSAQYSPTQSNSAEGNRNLEQSEPMDESLVPDDDDSKDHHQPKRVQEG